MLSTKLEATHSSRLRYETHSLHTGPVLSRTLEGTLASNLSSSITASLWGRLLSGGIKKTEGQLNPPNNVIKPTPWTCLLLEWVLLFPGMFGGKLVAPQFDHTR